MSLTDFEANFQLVLLIGIMLYSNHKYTNNYILQGFFIIMISIYAISIMSTEYLFALTLILFNAMLNIFYLVYRVDKI
jgi:hypothetical protein